MIDRYKVLEVSVCGFMCRFHGSKAQPAEQLPDSQSVVSGMGQQQLLVVPKGSWDIGAPKAIRRPVSSVRPTDMQPSSWMCEQVQNRDINSLLAGGTALKA